ncbi:hypothetical protein [Pseudodesulfovibrio senegalensis]|uniref:Uncharacterized protein n=1 Tax=Pseudodesulfovibrio senegalensis TaxID=1721087 RepID=A0A6N6MXK3_9BACT|nr:hypothetical protein [Pseudodesulfovibrio senegalensis]KAB1437315.1 hypothetical protein F8A88_15425 [Pseudodesulfovibrio senegalensis]
MKFLNGIFGAIVGLVFLVQGIKMLLVTQTAAPLVLFALGVCMFVVSIMYMHLCSKLDELVLEKKMVARVREKEE